MRRLLLLLPFAILTATSAQAHDGSGYYRDDVRRVEVPPHVARHYKEMKKHRIHAERHRHFRRQQQAWNHGYYHGYNGRCDDDRHHHYHTSFHENYLSFPFSGTTITIGSRY